MASNEQIENTVRAFSLMYLGGIPPMITDDSAFLSFICVLTAIEALAGYRYSDIAGKGERFKKFITDYYPDSYRKYSTDLWQFRNSMVHSFAPAKFALMHHHSECHLLSGPGNGVILNAEDFYGALLWAAQRYFAELRSDPILQQFMLARIASPDGGSTSVVAITRSQSPQYKEAE
jgi:hypothetical protein